MKSPSSRLVLLAAVAALAVAAIGFAGSARADSLDGRWTMSPMSEAYTVRNWVGACGPAPQSGNAGGGGPVKIVTEGDELTLIGGRVFRTNQCWDPMPTLVRDAHSRDPSGKRWSTRCSTPAGDPRRAVVTTQVVATSDNQIQIVETGRYEISLAEGTCVAEVRRASSLNLIERAGAAPTASASAPAATSSPAPAPAPAPGPALANKVDCSSPGDPARLEVRPSRKLLRTGETFTFKATVYDDKGCVAPTTTSWKNLAPQMPGRPSVGTDGVVRIGDDTPEMTFDVEASAAGKSTRVTVEVTSPSNYDELLARSGLNAQGENDAPSVVQIATASIGGADAKSDDAASAKKRNLFIGITVALAGLIGIVAVVGARRSRRAAELEREAEERHQDRLREYEARKQQKEAAHAAQMQAHLESVKRAQEAAAAATAAQLAAMGVMVCPSCRVEYPAGSVFCPNDANRLIALRGHESILTGPSGLVCPLCRRGYNPGIKVCPADGEELLPQAMVRPESIAVVKGKICPTCGGRFDGSAGFCGKDGTALVLLN